MAIMIFSAVSNSSNHPLLNQSPISAVFPIVQFAGDPKTALTGDPLIYKDQTNILKITKTIDYILNSR